MCTMNSRILQINRHIIRIFQMQELKIRQQIQRLIMVTQNKYNVNYQKYTITSQVTSDNFIKNSNNNFMNKSSLDKLLKADGHYAGDLVSLDFKSQSLQKFLESVVGLVNQHSQRINQLQIDKMPIDRLKAGTEKLIDAHKLSQTVLNTLPNIPQKNRIQTYEDTIEGISNNMRLNCHSIQYIYDNLKKKDEQINNITSQLGIFQKSEDTNDIVRKAVQGCKKYTDDQVDKLLTRVKQLEMRTNKKIAQFQNTTKDTEKKTLWKIKECQQTLLKKITPDYVEKAIDQLQSKIHNDIKNNKNQQMNELKFNLQTVKTKVDSLTRDVQDHQKQNKLLIKDLDQNIKTFEKRQKIDQDKREIDLRIKQMLLKIDRLEKKQDPHDVQLRLTKITCQHHEKIGGHHNKLKKIQDDLQSINNVMSSISGGSGGFDPHKLCHVDGEVRRLRDANRLNQTKLQVLEDELKTKLLVFEQRIMTTLGMLKGQDNFVSRQELYQSLSRLRQPVTQRMNENQNLIHELNGKFTKLELFQKATKRKIKQLTRGDQLNKILDMKLGVDQAQTHFNAINMKLQNLEIIFNKVKMEIQANSSFLDHLQKQMNQTEQGINIIGPKQKVFPAKCLGCGFKHNPVHENNMMMGSDGKYYRVDMRNSYTADQRQVYGVTPSQLAVYDMSTSKKSRVVPLTRPTSSKTVVRPSSASKYA